MKQPHLKSLLSIPWIGPVIAEDFWEFGLKKVSDFADADPEKIYEDLCDFHQERLHRCLLYIIRCAVYYASNETHDPALLKWWNWKDTALEKKP